MLNAEKEKIQMTGTDSALAFHSHSFIPPIYCKFKAATRATFKT